MTNPTDTMTLTDFLTARIADDETLTSRGWDGWGEYADVEFLAARFKAECAVKRAIVAEHSDGSSGHIAPFCNTCSDDAWLVSLPCPTLQHLAAVHADHPDYRDEWRP